MVGRVLLLLYYLGSEQRHQGMGSQGPQSLGSGSGRLSFPLLGLAEAAVR